MPTGPRRMLIAGNWKMNPGSGADARSLADDVRAEVQATDGVDVIVCPPTVHLGLVRDALRGSAIGVGAQTMHWAESGAYTGETSPLMLSTPPDEPLATHVVLGHSERRQYDGETDEAVGRKVAAAVGPWPRAARRDRGAARGAPGRRGGERDPTPARRCRGRH